MKWKHVYLQNTCLSQLCCSFHWALVQTETVFELIKNKGMLFSTNFLLQMVTTNHLRKSSIVSRAWEISWSVIIEICWQSIAVFAIICIFSESGGKSIGFFESSPSALVSKPRLCNWIVSFKQGCCKKSWPKKTHVFF